MDAPTQPSYTTLLSRSEMPRQPMHSVLLKNGKRIIIKLFFDASIFSLDRMVDIENLEDLSFVFEAVGGESASKFIFSYNNIKGEIVNNRNGIRFRVGSILAAAIGEARVLNQTRGFTSDEDIKEDCSVLKMNITLENVSPDDSTCPPFFYSSNHKFLLSCGKRKFELAGMKGGDPTVIAVHPSTEIAALHSLALFSIFFGKCSVPEGNPIRILDPMMGPLLLQFSLSLVAFGKKHRLALPNSQHSMSLIRFLDQFSFKVASQRLKSSVVNRILKHDVVIKEDTLEILDYMGDENISKKFFRRFTSIECLNEISRKYAGSLSLSNFVQLDERRHSLHGFMPNRPKIRFIFPEGEIVCSLFIDFYQSSIERLLYFIRSRLFTRPRLPSLWSLKGNLSLIHLPSSLPHQSTNSVNPPFSINPSLWLSYSTHGMTRKVSVYHGFPVKGLVLGTIESGSHLLSVVTVLERAVVV